MLKINTCWIFSIIIVKINRGGRVWCILGGNAIVIFEQDDLQSLISATEFLNNERPVTLFKTFSLLKGSQNLCQAQQNNKEFAQLRR